MSNRFLGSHDADIRFSQEITQIQVKECLTKVIAQSVAIEDELKLQTDELT